MFGLALPQTASGEEAHFLGVTLRADRAIGETTRHKEIQAAVRIREVNDGLLEGLWVFHKTHDTQESVLSQVYYCQNLHLDSALKPGADSRPFSILADSHPLRAPIEFPPKFGRGHFPRARL